MPDRMKATARGAQVIRLRRGFHTREGAAYDRCVTGRADPTSGPLQQLLETEGRRQVTQFVRGLPADERRALDLKHGLSGPEVGPTRAAAIMGISRGRYGRLVRDAESRLRTRVQRAGRLGELAFPDEWAGAAIMERRAA